MPLYISMPLSEELIPSFFVPSHPWKFWAPVQTIELILFLLPYSKTNNLKVRNQSPLQTDCSRETFILSVTDTVVTLLQMESLVLERRRDCNLTPCQFLTAQGWEDALSRGVAQAVITLHCETELPK